ncbi:TlpA family protein disulfide reductase [Microtetraspora niveoalba]|uniref:TlpA family protein disulfide reductase n=1 Tax=Microtetraspora niveoalba TaxID=46175 RepID=UPI000AD5675D|nr:redoxin domain-containing protein [Microtetraspora niveoalba]
MRDISRAPSGDPAGRGPLGASTGDPAGAPGAAAPRGGERTPCRARWVRPAVVVALAAALAAVLAYGLAGKGSTDPAVIRRVPHLAGTTLDGREFRTSELRGHVVLVNVWASWCGPCRDEFPLLLDIARRHARGGLRVVGVDTRDGREAARAFLAEFGATGFPHLFDPEGRLAVELGAFGVPETFLLDRNGVIVRRRVGPLTEEWIDANVLPELAA